MAASDNMSGNEGQSWNSWAETVGFRSPENEDGESEAEIVKKESDAMKLRKEDMELFGFCPAWDEFYLVVCELCNQVTKPQAFSNHIKLRHGSNAFTRSDRSDSHAMQSSKYNTGGSSKSSGSHLSQVSGRSSSVKSSGSKSGGQSSTSSSSSKSESRPPSSSLTKTTQQVLAPVVRVERMHPSLNKKTVTLNSINSLSTEKKELPSPQQPPPVTPMVAGLLAGPGPGSTLNTVVSPNSSSSGVHKTGGSTESSRQVNIPNSSVKKPSSSSKTKKVPKERKLLPCKDREYDPNKHCGVVVPDVGKPCTRSLTCKTHSLSMRRAVTGRKKSFDNLLADHRAAKEATLKAAAAASQSNSNSSSQPKSSVGDGSQSAPATTSSHGTSSSGSNNKFNSSPGQHKSPSSLKNSKQSSGKSSSSQINRRSSPPKTASTTSTSTTTPTNNCQETLSPPVITNSGPNAPDVIEVEAGKPELSNDPYVTHHPRPAAMCTFGLRQLGNGLFLLDRRWDVPRAALRSALSTDRSSHPPPLKRLCIESRLPPAPESVDPMDPYSFNCLENSAHGISPPVLSRLITTAPAVTTATSTQSRTSTVLNPARSTTSTTVTKSKPVTVKPNKTKDISTTVSSSSATTTSTSSSISKTQLKKKKPLPPATTPAVVSSPNPLSSLASAPGTVTFSAVTATHTLPISFPLTIGDNLGTLSRLQVTTSLVAGRNSLTISPALLRNQTVTASGNASVKDGAVVVTDVLNGQIPVNSALLHSVTISRPPALLTAPTSSLSLALVGQIPQLQQTHKMDSNKGNAASDHGGSSLSTTSSAKLKSKSRRTPVQKPAVTPVNHAVVFEGSGNIGSGGTKNHLSQITAPSPLLGSDAISSQVPVSTSLPNGLGLLPQSFIGGKGTLSSGTAGNHAIRTSSSSPGVESVSSPGCGTSKGKSSSSKHGLGHHKTQHPNTSTVKISMAPNISLSSLSVTGSGSKPITYQPVFANPMLSSPAHLTQLHLQAGKSSTTTTSPAGLALTTASLKFPYLPSSGIAGTGGTVAQPQHHLFLASDERGRSELKMQGSPSLPT